MLRRTRKFSALVALSLMAAPVSAQPSPGVGLDAQTRALLKELHGLLQEDLAQKRADCAAGIAPAWVQARRATAGPNEPFADAANMCVGSLQNAAQERRLGELYAALLKVWGRSEAGAEGLPRSIGAAALKGETKVPIGGGKAAIVTPALAFDAGFTVAYAEGKAPQGGKPNPQQLKALAEACLAQQRDVGSCFSAGYFYGAQAVTGRVAIP